MDEWRDARGGDRRKGLIAASVDLRRSARSTRMDLAIIGAGVSGLSCARVLVAGGHRVTVFERSHAPGGRAATRRTEVGDFDHGARYLTASTPSFLAQVAAWQRDGVVAPWPAATPPVEAIEGEAAARAAADLSTVRWVGVPGMSSIGAAMARDLDVRHGSSIVAAVRRCDAGSAPRWSLMGRGDQGDDPVLVAPSFDGVVVAVPGPSAIPLLDASPALARMAANATFESCWAVMLCFAEPLVIGRGRVERFVPVDGPLAWIARESSKPGREPGERWIAHARADWSREHLGDGPDEVRASLLDAFHEAAGTSGPAVVSVVHRWRHAAASSPLTDGYLWDADQCIGACGDWCRGQRIEDAWLSGVLLGAAIGAAASTRAAQGTPAAAPTDRPGR